MQSHEKIGIQISSLLSCPSISIHYDPSVLLLIGCHYALENVLYDKLTYNHVLSGNNFQSSANNFINLPS